MVFLQFSLFLILILLHNVYLGLLMIKIDSLKLLYCLYLYLLFFLLSFSDLSIICLQDLSVGKDLIVLPLKFNSEVVIYHCSVVSFIFEHLVELCNLLLKFFVLFLELNFFKIRLVDKIFRYRRSHFLFKHPLSPCFINGGLIVRLDRILKRHPRCSSLRYGSCTGHSCCSRSPSYQCATSLFP